MAGRWLFISRRVRAASNIDEIFVMSEQVGSLECMSVLTGSYRPQTQSRDCGMEGRQLKSMRAI